MTITIRYRTTRPEGVPAFSNRNFQSLSLNTAAAGTPPEGFADAILPARGATLAESIYLSGLFLPPALCSAIGTCGLCRVRYLKDIPPPSDAERETLSHHDLDAGWRLACRRPAEGGTHVLVPAWPVPDEHDGKPTPLPAVKRPRPASLAVDLGTTTVAWRIVTDGDGEKPHGSFINPQMGAGSDVISRVAHAATPEGAARLAHLITAALERLVRHATTLGFRTDEICVAANPAMTAILLGKSTACLARAPYSLPFAGASVATLPGLPPVYIPPPISPFVGGDASAGYAALALDPDREPPEFPFLLADIGTNGECILALSPDEAFAASTPMGPALEGINLRYGMTAGPGAVLEYTLTPLGLEPVTRENTAPTGITATGYLTLLKALRATGILTEEGTFAAPGGASPLAARIGGNQSNEGHGARRKEPSIRLPGKMMLFASDVEEILKVKAAFSLAISRLLREAGLRGADLKRICLAGALGTNAPASSLTGLGFLPPGTETRIRAVGNTALDGAALLLAREETRKACADWAGRIVTVDLAGDPGFGEEYARHMAFAWHS